MRLQQLVAHTRTRTQWIQMKHHEEDMLHHLVDIQERWWPRLIKEYEIHNYCDYSRVDWHGWMSDFVSMPRIRLYMIRIPNLNDVLVARVCAWIGRVESNNHHYRLILFVVCLSRLFPRTCDVWIYNFSVLHPQSTPLTLHLYACGLNCMLRVWSWLPLEQPHSYN